MVIKDSIFELLKKEYDLRKKIADELNLREGAVHQWAYRKAHAKVGNYLVVNIIKAYAGITDEDIFETEIA